MPCILRGPDGPANQPSIGSRLQFEREFADAAGLMSVMLLILVIAPLWINYLMRMLAWVNLLAPDGYVNRFLTYTHILSEPRDWLGGQASTVILALTYGYLVFMILPIYAALDRMDPSLIEAGKDLYGSKLQTFLHVTLPLSKLGILGGAVLIALPMFGDYYTPNIVSGAAQTSMIGNQIDFYFHGGPQPTIGAAITIVLAAFLTLLMGYYLWTIHRSTQQERTT